MTSTNAGLNLLILDKADPERDAVAEAFKNGGGKVHRLDRFWEPPAFDPATVRVYGSDSFSLVLQQKLGFSLCSPADDLLLRVPARFLQRELIRCSLAETLSSPFPVFTKPVTPKQFRGAVYGSSQGLADECRGLAPTAPVFVSEIVSINSEVRTFLLDGRVLDAAFYEGSGVIADAIAFTHELARTVALPRTVVVDVGFVAGRGWAVIEFNASWGAGLNGCDATKVLPAILAATGGGRD